MRLTAPRLATILCRWLGRLREQGEGGKGGARSGHRLAGASSDGWARRYARRATSATGRTLRCRCRSPRGLQMEQTWTVRERRESG
jgi:hypothetical protein